MASTTVSEISRLDLQELGTPALASITDVKLLSSYNWIEAPNATPTIAVPGSPALWSAPGASRFPFLDIYDVPDDTVESIQQSQVHSLPFKSPSMV